MRWRRGCACIWPGLADLWQQGSWSGLLLALIFGLLLNFSLAASLIWTEWASPELRFAAWTGVGSFWLIGFCTAWRQTGLDRSLLTQDLFSQAVNEYLQGNWFQAESLLEQVLRKNRRDVDAQLMLATLYRHTGRCDEARAALEQIKCWRGAEKWELEIQREREQLAAASEQAPDEDQKPGTSPEAGHSRAAASQTVQKSRAA